MNDIRIPTWLSNYFRANPASTVGFPGAISVGSIFLVCLLAMTGNWVLIPEGIAYLYGIGNIEGATLLLDKEGCSTAQGLGGEEEARS